MTISPPYNLNQWRSLGPGVVAPGEKILLGAKFQVVKNFKHKEIEKIGWHVTPITKKNCKCFTEAIIEMWDYNTETFFACKTFCGEIWFAVPLLSRGRWQHRLRRLAWIENNFKASFVVSYKRVLVWCSFSNITYTVQSFSEVRFLIFSTKFNF